MRISDWSSDGCSSDLNSIGVPHLPLALSLSKGCSFLQTFEKKEWCFDKLSTGGKGKLRPSQPVQPQRFAGLARDHPARLEVELDALQPTPRLRHAGELRFGQQRQRARLDRGDGPPPLDPREDT